MKIDILQHAFHRNGVCGIPFEVALFNDGESDKLAIVFATEHHCAVLDLFELLSGNIRFGSNSWRGDRFEPHVCEAIRDFCERQERSLS